MGKSFYFNKIKNHQRNFAPAKKKRCRYFLGTNKKEKTTKVCRAFINLKIILVCTLIPTRIC